MNDVQAMQLFHCGELLGLMVSSGEARHNFEFSGHVEPLLAEYRTLAVTVEYLKAVRDES